MQGTGGLFYLTLAASASLITARGTLLIFIVRLLPAKVWRRTTAAATPILNFT